MFNFRNLEGEFSFGKGINLVFGPNGSGKTSLLESIAYLSIPRSFRGVRDYALVKWGGEFFKLEARIYRFDNPHDISISVKVDGTGRTEKKIYKKDGRLLKTYGEIFKTFVVLSFSSREHAFMDGPPVERRRLFDWALSLLDDEYFSHLVEYKKLIVEKKGAIKSNQPLIYWNRALVPHIAYIVKARKDFVEMVNTNIKYKFVPSSFRVYYKPSLRNPEDINLYESEEKQRGFPTVGPHRDEFVITIDDKPVKIYASEGQKRRIHLGIILFLGKLIENKLNDKPVMVLDEPFVYLDNDGTYEVLETLDGQVFISSSKPLLQGVSKNDIFTITLQPYN